MKKDRIEEQLPVSRSLLFRSPVSRSLGLPVFALVLFLCLCSPKPALAGCEPAGAGPPALATLIFADVNNLNLFIIQEASFIFNILTTAFQDMANAHLEFATNVENALNTFARNWYTAILSMTAELHASQVDQSYRIGGLIDGQLMTEEGSRKENLTIDAQKRYTPSELACDIDTTGPGLERAYLVSRAFNRGLAQDDAPRHENAVGSISATGKGAEINSTWIQFVADFCDNTMGDLGCTAPGTIAGQERDIGQLLWGPLQTIDPTNQNNILAMQAALRYIIDPLASDPIPPPAAASPAGHSQILERHAEQAYVNTIYNTLGGMLSERIGGSNVNVQQMRNDAGIPLTEASTDASYREIQEAMTRDRFNNPDYLVKLVSDPAQVMREQTTLNALRLQTLSDIFRRSEEMLVMELAEYARDLNAQIPRAETNVMPLH